MEVSILTGERILAVPARVRNPAVPARARTPALVASSVLPPVLEPRQYLSV